MTIRREIVLDIETTGLNYKTGDKIVEIACVELNDKMITNNFFHTYINPQQKIQEAAYKIHGISNNELVNKPSFKNIANDLIEFLQDSPLVIHNANFDVGFINNELFHTRGKILKNNIIDTLTLSKKKFPTSSVNLNALCKRFNISIIKRKKHGALIDAKLLAQVYLRMTEGEQQKFNFINIQMIKQENFKYNCDFCFTSFKEEACHKFIVSKSNNTLWNCNS